MQVLVVHAHPDPASFSRALFDAAVRTLRAGGHTVDAVDLYGDGFDPAMPRADREAYHSEVPIIDDQVAGYAEMVRRADALVFVYPTWWAGLPAMLKGFLDRVLVPTVAIGFDESGKVVPAMTHVRRIAGITTYGSPPWLVHALGDAGRRTITRTLRLVCGRRRWPQWMAMYRMDTAGPDERAAFVDDVERKLARW